MGAGVNVTFNVNGVHYTRQTNSDGVVTLSINLNPGEYTVSAMYGGCTVSNNVTVLPVLSADDISMSYRDGSKFAAKLVDAYGRPYAGQVVTFNVHGVFYNRTTGSDGVARLNINLMSGEYIITSMYEYARISNNIRVKV